MTVQVNDFLMHYGVPGMKWGRRRAKSQSSGSSGARRKMSPETKAKLVYGAQVAATIGGAVALAALHANGAGSNLRTPPISSVERGRTLAAKLIAEGQFQPSGPRLFPGTSTGTSGVRGTMFEKFDTPSGARPMPAGKSAPPTPPRPAPSSANVNRPKAPSPYPMTPLIKTPILDEINRKYGFHA